MKKILFRITVSAAICCVSFTAFGLGGGLPPSNDYSGRPQCLWYDKGWDENGGNSTKEQCLVEHDQCVQKCFIYKTVCEGSGIDIQGKKVLVSGQSTESWEARAKIFERCNADRLSSCMVTNCREESQLL
ncbi:MAG: hypothetical protein ACK5P5_12495 [Pseudobdellovibrionaceae bacterium]